MAPFLLFSCLLVLGAGIGTLIGRSTALSDAGKHLDEVERATGVTVPPDVRLRLIPVVVRRRRWPATGRVSGYVIVAFSLYLTGAFSGTQDERPWLLPALISATAYVFAIGAGDLVAHLAAGYRGFPPDPRALRSAQPDARRLDAYVAPVLLSAWLGSTVAVVLTLPLSVVVAQRSTGTAAVPGLAAAAGVLSLAALLVLRLLLRRPVPGLGAERAWQEALLAQSFGVVAQSAAVTNTAAVALGLTSVAVLHTALPPVVGLAATALLVAALGGVGLLARSWALGHRPAALRPGA